MSAIKETRTHGFPAISPLQRIYRIVSRQRQKNKNIHELSQMSAFLKEDIGLLR